MLSQAQEIHKQLVEVCPLTFSQRLRELKARRGKYMPTKKANDLPRIIKNNNLTTLYVDNAQILSRKDGMYFIRYTANLPEGEVEQARLMTDKENLHDLLDTMCLDANYYPKKPMARIKRKSQDKPLASKTSEVV
jgi:hypothetical protein